MKRKNSQKYVFGVHCAIFLIGTETERPSFRQRTETENRNRDRLLDIPDKSVGAKEI